jgi:hypothetical protein
MNKTPHSGLMELADSLALRVQQLRAEGLFDPDDILLNLDYSSQASRAPFVFDMARGVLHRNHCRAIPADSQSALYALDRISADDAPLACPVCRPSPLEAAVTDAESMLDVILGLLSFLDQFDSVLRERGREYRTANRTSRFAQRFEELLVRFGQLSAPSPGAPVAPPADAGLSEPPRVKGAALAIYL